jgi:hypothetical protein
LNFNIYSNLHNGAGLEKDGNLFSTILKSRGHNVFGVDYGRWQYMPRPADVNIFLEIVEPAMLESSVAKQNWMVPNWEWWGANWDSLIPRFDKILCKTKDAYRIARLKAPESKCVYMGFEASDIYNPSIRREPIFLHLAGKSETKNTAAVTEAWRQFRIPYQLTVSAFKPEIVRLCQNIPHVNHVTRFGDGQVRDEMNRHIFHVMPSKYEGYGHAIHEALSCGGIVITTGAPPMCDFEGVPSELLIPVVSTQARPPAVFNIVSSRNVAEAVHKAARLSGPQVDKLADAARKGFLRERDFFRSKIGEILDAVSL